jgi:hypothetical protein
MSVATRLFDASGGVIDSVKLMPVQNETRGLAARHLLAVSTEKTAILWAIRLQTMV